MSRLPFPAVLLAFLVLPAARGQEPAIVVDNRPEVGIPPEALAQVAAKLAAPKAAPPAQKVPKTLHALTHGRIKTVRIRYFDKNTWATEEQARQYVAGLFANKALAIHESQFWSQGVGTPEFECLVDFNDAHRKTVLAAQKPFGEGRLLLWNTVGCFRDATGQWWFVDAYDYFHGAHPKGDHAKAKGTKPK